MQTPAGVKKVRETMIKKHGSYEAWCKYMQQIGSKGGTQTYKSGKLALVGFGSNKERARTAGKIGGERPRRTYRKLETQATSYEPAPKRNFLSFMRGKA
jgi:general stress protein YciG